MPPHSRSAPSKRIRASLQRREPYPPIGRVAASDLGMTRVQNKRRVNRRKACDHCRAARRRCTIPLPSPSLAAEDISPPSDDVPPPCQQCTAAKRDCKYDGDDAPAVGEVGSAGGWSEWRSEGRVMELDDRLARLEQALQAKLAQLDRSAELDDPCLHAADHFETSSVIVSTTEMDEDGVRRIQDGVRRLSVEQNASAADPREVLIAKTNEQKLSQALSAFELGWMHETLSPGPGAWSGVGAVEQEGKERMARELKELVEGLAASRMDAISPVLDHTHPPNPHSNIYPLHSDLSPWRSDADSHFGAHSSFASSPSSPWTEPSSPRTPHSPYTPFQVDYSQPQVASSPSVGSSPMGLGRLSLGDEEWMVWEGEQCAVDSWKGKELFGKQQTSLFAPRGRARTLDEVFQPTPPPLHHPSYPPTPSTLSHIPQHSSLGLWDSSPPPSTHSSLGLIFSPFPPTFITASTSPQAPLTRTHSLESTSSTPPPFSSTYSPLAFAGGSTFPPLPTPRIVKPAHQHHHHQSWDGRYDARLWQGEGAGSSLAGLAGGVGTGAERGGR